MDATGLVRLTCAINAFGARGDANSVPVTAVSRAMATKASALLTRRLVFSHLRGDGVVLDLDGLCDLAVSLDELVGQGDGLGTPLSPADVVAVWQLRLEIQVRLTLMEGGIELAEALDHTPLGHDAWRAAAAAAARVPGAPRWAPMPEEEPASHVAAPFAAPVIEAAAEAPETAAADAPEVWTAAPPPPAPDAANPTDAPATEPEPVAPLAVAADEPEVSFVVEGAEIIPADPEIHWDDDADGEAGADEEAATAATSGAAATAAGGHQGGQQGAQKLGMFSRAILKMHSAVENMAAPPKPDSPRPRGG